MQKLKPSVTPIDRDDPERMLNSREVAARIGISVETLYNWQMVGKGPKGRKLSSSHRSQTRWKLKDVIEWENSLPTTTRPSVEEAARKVANGRL